MLSELDATLKAVKAAYDFVTGVRKDHAETERRFDDAVDAVFVACARTRAYLARFEQDLRGLDEADAALPTRATERVVLESQRFRDMMAEAALSDLWREAARRVRAFDGDLHDRLMVKAYCWADPRLFTTKRYGGIRQGLDDIFDEAREMVRRRRDPDALARKGGGGLLPA
jgi:hypothetical protein